MRFPVDNFLTDWNLTAGNGFGVPTSYGFHEGSDLNLNGGGNIDLGQPLFAVADGIITSVHTHIGSPTFGKHLHLKINIDGKDYWVHYAHCDQILITEGTIVKKGDKIATCGNSGTTFAHLHLAIKNQPTGVDGIAKTQEDLTKWENPIEFIKKHYVNEPMVTMTQKEADLIRLRRDELYNLSEDQKKVIEGLRQDLQKEQENSKTYIQQLEKITEEEKTTTEQLIVCSHALQPFKDEQEAIRKALGVDSTDHLVEDILNLKKSKMIKSELPIILKDKIIFCFNLLFS